ncbi:MAG TPA: hypothetical protein VMT63_05245 [Bacteroidales bacterium]|nr:hypothetical protein [Bacteroidales bacterium]
MKHKRLLRVLAFSLVAIAAVKVIPSSFVDWEKTKAEKTRTGWTRSIFKSPTSSLDLAEVVAYTLYPGKATHQFLVDRQNEEVYLVKEGSAVISVDNNITHLTEGGLAIVSQGNRVVISNKGTDNLVYYSIRLKPRYVKPSGKNSKRVRTYFSYSDTVRPGNISAGNIFPVFSRSTLSLKNLDLHTIRLKSDFNNIETLLGTEEELVLVRRGIIFGNLRGRQFRLGKGSMLFLTGKETAEIENGSETDCEYYVIKWLAWSPEPKK